MIKSAFRRATNRVLHLLARNSPGGTTFRPLLHRLRGASIGRGVFIGDDVYLENEYPAAVEICDGVQIGVRAMLLAHTRGAGRIIIEKDVFIGANAVIAASGNRTIRIGEGSVIGAGTVITFDVPARTFIAAEPPKPVARVRTPLTKAERMEDFVRGLAPIPKRRR